jgi:5-hydroxyisourate hydrolase-like protein (transthyretin family)
MINNTKVNRHVPTKNFLTALTISLLLILVGNVANIPIFEPAYASNEFNINVDIEYNEIKRGDIQHVTVTVFNDDTDNRISDADVKLTVYPPDSDSTSAEDETDNDGRATFDVKIDDNAETGTYDVAIRVSKDGYDTKTVNTSFDVVKSSGHDDEDNDDEKDYNGSSSSSSSSSAASASAASSENSDSGSSTASSASSSNNNNNNDGGGGGTSSSSSSSAAVGDAAAAAAASSGASSAAAAAASTSSDNDGGDSSSSSASSSSTDDD